MLFIRACFRDLTKGELNMKKVLMMIAAVMCSILFVSAQEGRNRTYRVSLGNVQYTHHDEKMSAGEVVGKVIAGAITGQTSVQVTKYEEDVRSAIIKGLSGSYRFRYDDGLSSLDHVVDEGDIVVDALITNIQANSSSRSWKDKDDKTHVETWYTGVAEAALSIKDAKTGEVIANQGVRGQGSTNSMFSTGDQAIRDAIGRLSSNISAWLNRYRPLQANILEGAGSKKDKQKEVYIDLGSSEGAFVGLLMGVYGVKIVAGREARTQIGRLRIEAVEGVDISRCKVVSGGKEIKAAIENGEKLSVLSID